MRRGRHPPAATQTNPENLMFYKNPLTLAVAAALTAASATSQAQDAGALVDALVRKGILTDQEAEEIRADMTREFTTTSAGKINLSNSITELKLYGDLRLRYQYDNKDLQADPFPVGAHVAGSNEKDRSPNSNQRSRWRFRLRLNADFKLSENFFGGVELATAMNSDSGNQTFENGFNDYPIFISKAYLGWSPNEWLTMTAGKVPNPFYATDASWDPDINPTGLTETIALHKLHFGGGALGGGGGLSKDGKSYAPTEVKADRPWELSLVAGQFIFDDNPENTGPDNDASTDAYLFETQLIAAYKFSGGAKLTIAPAWMTFINGSLSGLDNENMFQDNANVSGATRNLNLLLFPGDLSFKLGDLKAKFYWDFSYNIEARKRVEDIYNLVTLRRKAAGQRADPNDFDKQHSQQDDFMYLIGLQIGENKKKGDWSVLANWRQTGIAAVDPNLTDSDFALGELNTRGFKIGLAYNLTDFCVGAVTYMHAWNLRDNLTGGEATGGNAIAEGNQIQVLQVDLSVKF
jgi:hypothetical protein